MTHANFTEPKCHITSLTMRSNYSKCPRCWQFTKNGLFNFDNLCNRCCDVLIKNYPNHESTLNIINRTPQYPEYYFQLWSERSQEFADEMSETFQRVCDILPNDLSKTPEVFLGPNFQTVINFWNCLDHVDMTKWKEIENSVEISNDHFSEMVSGIKDTAWWAITESVALIAPKELPKTIKIFETNPRFLISKASYAAVLATFEMISSLKYRCSEPKFIQLFI